MTRDLLDSNRDDCCRRRRTALPHRHRRKSGPRSNESRPATRRRIKAAARDGSARALRMEIGRARLATTRSRPCTLIDAALGERPQDPGQRLGLHRQSRRDFLPRLVQLDFSGPSLPGGKRPSIMRTSRWVALSSVRYSISRRRMCRRWLRCPSMRRHVSGLSRRIAMYSSVRETRDAASSIAATADTGYTGAGHEHHGFGKTLARARGYR